MATHAIGKLKMNFSDKGMAWRWGDGSIHRLFGGKKDKAESEYETYETDGDATGQDRFDARDDGYDPGYDDYEDGDYDDRYADDDYDDRDYDDDYGDDYDDEEYDGRYDSPDYDDDYEDDYEDGDYDDRYSSEDAGEDGYYAEQSGLMQYVDDHDWVTYALLFACPPLGIYLLWRRNRFDKPIRYAISAASALWFIVALILIFHGLSGGAGDQQTQPNITIPLATTEATDAPGDETGTDIQVAATDAGDTGSDATPAPTALPDATSAGLTLDDTSYVWSPATGLYYHNTEDCSNIDPGVSVSRIPQEVAVNSRHQVACPVCIGGGDSTIYYATRGGTYYHLDATCSDMRDPQTYTKEAAENAGKKPCPVCVTKTIESLDATSANVKFISTSTTDKSGMEVYSTKGGTYFHVKSSCSGMEGATKSSLRDALLSGKVACPTCCPTAGTQVYCTAGGKSYHVDPNCSGMTGAKQVSLAEALVLGKAKCDVCIKGSISDIGGSSEASESGSTSVAKGESDFVNSSGTTYVYATKGGKYYHTNSTCSGMKDAEKVTLKSMLAENRKPCPVCASSAKTTVYYTKGGKYYHSYATCSDMKGASSSTLAEALASGKRRCPKCWGSGSASAKSTQTASAANGATQATSGKDDSGASAMQTVSESKKSASRATATASNTYVYATQDGSYYHLKSSCGGMKNASRVSLRTAINAGKKPCPICASSAGRTVYSTKSGKYYHAASSCPESGLKNGSKRTLAQALMLNQTACPYCIGGKSSGSASTQTSEEPKDDYDAITNLKSSGTYHSGKSGIKVYTTASGRYYHTSSSCQGMTNATRVTLETALNYGKKACPVCASSAGRTVYVTKGGKYYHFSKSDAGSGASRVTLGEALASGYDPCPGCVTKTESTATTTYKSGTSGIKVYATTHSKYFHSKPNCSGMEGASRISLETALNNGKAPCPTCMATAGRKVYAVSGDNYYHYSKSHAGHGAKAGTLASAKAYGLKPCPVCTGASEISDDESKDDEKDKTDEHPKEDDKPTTTDDNGSSPDAPVSTVDYGASGDSGVYIDIGSANNYYHKSSSCSSAKFSGGTKVTLEYARDWGYKACPYCNPPTKVIAGSTDT